MHWIACPLMGSESESEMGVLGLVKSGWFHCSTLPGQGERKNNSKFTDPKPPISDSGHAGSERGVSYLIPLLPGLSPVCFVGCSASAAQQKEEAGLTKPSWTYLMHGHCSVSSSIHNRGNEVLFYHYSVPLRDVPTDAIKQLQYPAMYVIALCGRNVRAHTTYSIHLLVE